VTYSLLSRLTPSLGWFHWQWKLW